MITINNLNKSFGGQNLFEDACLKINKGERVGIVGRNGYGKSTLFKMITGEEEINDGSIVTPKNYKIGFLKQTLSFCKNSVVEECSLALSEDEKDATWKSEKILAGLGFSKSMFLQNPQELSGGFQVRLNLAKLLVQKLDMLLLDEPNNYLDISSIRWLADFLKSFEGEILLITHDRSFMDSIVTHVAGIYRCKLKKSTGSTSKYYASIEQEEEVHEKTRINEEKKVKQMETFINKFRAKARQANMVQSRIKTLEKIKPLQKISKTKNLSFNFNETEFNGKYSINVKNLTFGYNKYNILIKNLNFCANYGDKICIIGKNGKGKTTLLKILAGCINEINSDSVCASANTKTAYYEQTNTIHLNPNNTILEEVLLASQNMDVQTARNICGTMMFSDDMALKNISVLSGGEKCRVLLSKIIATPCNLLLLDEPTNHLDMDSCNSLLEAIKSFNGTVIMITHNEYFLKELAEKLVIFNNDTVNFFDGNYDLFLNQIGWDDEAENKKNTSSTTNKNKDNKRLKAELIQEKSRVLNPLQDKIKKLETEISEKEQDIFTFNQKLLEASYTQNGNLISDISIKISNINKELEFCYMELEPVLDEFEKKSKEFDTAINNIG